MFFFARPEKFSSFFRDQGQLIQAATVALHQGVLSRDVTSFIDVAHKIAKLEDQCDLIKREIITELGRNFITPFDPEDLLALARHLDDIMDGLEETAYCLSAYKIKTVSAVVTEMCVCLLEASQKLTHMLAPLPKLETIREDGEAIFDLEKIADNIHRKAIVDLFAHETDPINLIKFREIYASLEQTMDAYAHAAGTLQNLQVKNT